MSQPRDAMSISSSVSSSSLVSDELNDVTYKTVDKGPKKVNQYILGEILGEGIFDLFRNQIFFRELRKSTRSN
jgi:hypothetical protein